MAESDLGENLKIWGNVADKAPRGCHFDNSPRVCLGRSIMQDA